MLGLSRKFPETNMGIIDILFMYDSSILGLNVMNEQIKSGSVSQISGIFKPLCLYVVQMSV